METPGETPGEALVETRSFKSLPYASNFDLESVLKIVQILTLRELFGTFALVKIHTLREHFWRYKIEHVGRYKITQILTLRERFSIFNNSSVFQSMKSTPYPGFFQPSSSIRKPTKSLPYTEKSGIAHIIHHIYPELPVKKSSRDVRNPELPRERNSRDLNSENPDFCNSGFKPTKSLPYARFSTEKMFNYVKFQNSRYFQLI